MNIVVQTQNDNDYGCRQQLIINGKKRQYVGSLCECPEDAIIGRDLVSCSEIVSFMKEAYEAGKNGESFDYSEIKVDEIY
jgi:hypothetical protein